MAVIASATTAWVTDDCPPSLTRNRRKRWPPCRRSAHVLVEEGQHPPPAVLGRVLVVSARHRRRHTAEPALPAVDARKEGMPGAIVDLDVVGHAERAQVAL